MHDIRSLSEEFCARLSAVYESMAGERPEVHVQPAADLPAAADLVWRQRFSGVEGTLWVAAAEADWSAAARPILRAAGIEEDDPAGLKSTYLETLGQALSGIAQALTEQLGNEINCSGGEEKTGAAFGISNAAWSPVTFQLGPDQATLWIACDAILLSEMAPASSENTAAPRTEPAAETSHTFDLLLEVELPVSISFGRAQVQLKDILKLTTGSVVELNRAVAEPVEVIVNNCVIARGEVVVIEGNFGVRILQVVSRNERLRTLN